MYEWYMEIRDRICNKLIRFLLRHCAIHSLTLRECMNKVEWQQCFLIVKSMKEKAKGENA